MGGGTGDGFGGVYRKENGSLVMIDGFGRIFHDSENPEISEKYFKSPMSELYEVIRDYAVNIISKLKKQKDISSKF